MKTIQYFRTIEWFDENYDNSLRLDYKLTSDAIVFDVGGYRGDWTKSIWEKYHCTIFVFEPVPEFYNIIIEKFKNNPKIKIYNFGLAKKDAIVNFVIEYDASSQFSKSSNSVKVQIKDITEFIKNNAIKNISLLKLNVEGAEYDILERLIETDKINTIDNIQVQFHDFIPGALERMHEIQNNLKLTHFLTYQFEFVWENWQLKKLFGVNNSIQIPAGLEELISLKDKQLFDVRQKLINSYTRAEELKEKLDEYSLKIIQLDTELKE